MSRKTKYTLVQKTQVCEDSILEWVRICQENGYEAFISRNHNSRYTKEFKLMVVKYVSDLGSTRDLAIKYKIKSNSTVNNWILKYNKQAELRNYKPVPEVYTMETRKTTKEERIKIIKWCLAHTNDYNKTAKKFKSSYAQVYQWVYKYKNDGEDGFSERRG